MEFFEGLLLLILHVFQQFKEFKQQVQLIMNFLKQYINLINMNVESLIIILS